MKKIDITILKDSYDNLLSNSEKRNLVRKMIESKFRPVVQTGRKGARIYNRVSQ